VREACVRAEAVVAGLRLGGATYYGEHEMLSGEAGSLWDNVEYIMLPVVSLLQSQVKDALFAHFLEIITTGIDVSLDREQMNATFKGFNSTIRFQGLFQPTGISR
jgi:hypothetical protein